MCPSYETLPAAAESREGWKLIAETVPGGYFVYRADGNEEIIYANKRMLQIFGCESFEDLVSFTGGTFRGLVYPDDYTRVVESIRQQISQAEKDRELDYVEYRIRRKDGNIRWIYDYGRLVEIDGVKYFNVFAEDQTELHQMQEKRTKRAEEYNRKLSRMRSQKNRLPKAVLAAVASLIMLAFTVLYGRSYFLSLNDQMFRERQVNLIEIADKSADILDVLTSAAWQNVSVLENVMTAQPYEDRSALQTALGRIGSGSDNVVFLAFDRKGNYYASNGQSGKWPQMDMLTADAPEYQSAIIDIVRGSGTDDTQSMVFVRRVAAPFSAGKTEIRFVGLALDIGTVREMFSVKAFDTAALMYITDENGRRLYKYNYEEDLLNNYNIISAFEAFDYFHGSAEELAAASASGESIACEFSYEGENRFVAVVPANGSEWRVVLVVPTEVLGADTAAILNSTMRFFAVVGAALLLFLLLLVGFIIRAGNNRRIMLQEFENNAELQELNDQLQSAREDAEEAQKRAEEANAAKTIFLSNMSHDIRTPINGVMGMTDIALRHLDDPARVEDCLHKIDGSSHHLLALINDVLDLSRIESGKTGVVSAPMDIRTVCDNCASIIGGQLAGRNVELVRDYDHFEHPFVFGDELHLRQIFINILGNSVKFTPDGGKIMFRAKELPVDEDHVVFRFELEDTGIGMKPEFIPKIFDAFSMEEEGARTTYKGTGLGMAITKKFLDMMNGSVQITSELNVGTCFTLEIPYEIDHERIPQEESGPLAGSVDLKGMRILLAEDNELNAEIAVELLQDNEVNVDVAVNGRLAVDAFAGQPEGTYDAILMDIMMPVMNGYDATRAIRALDRPDASSVPIIALSANAYDEDIRRSHAAGMNAHISKPIQPEMVLKTLMSLKKQDEEHPAGA